MKLSDLIRDFHNSPHTLCKSQRSFSHSSKCKIVGAPIDITNYRRPYMTAGCGDLVSNKLVNVVFERHQSFIV